MQRYWILLAPVLHAVALAAAPWVARWRPWWAPALLAVAALTHPSSTRQPWVRWWGTALVGLSALSFVGTAAGVRGAAVWLLAALCVAAVARALPARASRRPDAADGLAALAWAVPVAGYPPLANAGPAVWLGGALLLLSSLTLGRSWLALARRGGADLAPPSRPVRGTLSLRGVVVPGPEGLPRSVPIDLELRAGDSLAVLCDSGSDSAAFADLLCARRSPVAGEVMMDGAPLAKGDRLVAVVALGERFIPGDLEDNLGVLCEQELEPTTLTALSESCSLDEVAAALGDATLDADGEPLTPLYRLLVLAARVIPSSYRVVLALDPMPWVNAVWGEVWRASVVRASVGRTAVWITPDRELAGRADHVMEYRNGALREVRLEEQRAASGERRAGA